MSKKAKTLLIVTFFVFSALLAQAAPSDNLSGWAFSDMPNGSDSGIVGSGQTGKGAYWISFNPNANYGVNVAADGTISGYAWANPNDGSIENIGWISFMSGDVAGCPSAPCRPTLDRTTGVVDGWAKALWADGNGWDGWIHLKGSTYGVTVSGCIWSGWAWGSDVMGWIHFSGPTYGVTGTGNACVVVTPTPTPTVSVTPTPTPTPGAKSVDLSASPSSLIRNNGSFNVDWNFTGGYSALESVNDWVGMYLIGTGDTAYIESHQTFGGSNGSLSFSSDYNPGTYEFRYFDTLTGYSGNSIGLSNPVIISISPTPTPTPTSTPTPIPFNFSLSNGGQRIVVQNNSTQNLITANLISGNTEPVDFQASGLPAGTTYSFSILTCNPTCSTTLTINTTLSTPPGDYLVTVSGISTALTRTTQFTLTVNPAPVCADGIDNDCDGFCDQSGCMPPAGFCNAGISLPADPSCSQSGGGTEYSACNDLNSDGTLRDNDGDGIANIFDPGCHSDGNPNNPNSYNPNDNDESNTIFREVFTPFKKLMALLFNLL